MGAPALCAVLHHNAPSVALTAGSGGYDLLRNLMFHGVAGFINHAFEGNWHRREGLDAIQLNLDWAESLLVVDAPNRVVLWDSLDREFDAPRLVAHLIEATSPGWRAVWCPNPGDPVRQYLGCGESELNGGLPQKRLTLSDEHFGPFEMPEHGFGDASLFTAVLNDGQSACWLTESDHNYLPHADICQVTAVAEKARDADLTRFASWPSLGGGETYDVWPSGGAHLDFRTKTVWGWSFWTIDWSQTFPDRSRGWRFVEVGDCWEVHIGHTGGRPISQPLRDMMLEYLGFWSDGSPISAQLLNPDGKDSRLEALVRDLIQHDPQIAPSAFLQNDGTICWDPRSLHSSSRSP